MRQEVIWIGIVICAISIFVYIVKNFFNFGIDKKVNNNNSKAVKIVNIIIVITMIFFLYIFLNKSFNSIKLSIQNMNNNKNAKNDYRIYDNKIYEENSFYKSIINLNYECQNYSFPYSLDGFNYVEGNWDNGYVIEDSIGNQFVWVPCTNYNDTIIPKLEKRYFASNDFISKDYCYDIQYEEFLKSSLTNGGFYISRYEIGNEENAPVSKKNVKLWNNVTQSEAINLASNMYESNSFNSELINGYAYDTVLTWINNTNTLIIENNKTEEIYTGRNNPYNNIYDINDNILEITSEKNYDTVVTRGMYNELAFDKYSDLIDMNNNRYSILEDIGNSYTSFRIVLYKK